MRYHALLHAALVCWRIDAIDYVWAAASDPHYFFSLWEVFYILVLLLISSCVGVLDGHSRTETKVSFSQLCLCLKSLLYIFLIRNLVAKLNLSSRFTCELWVATDLDVWLSTLMDNLWFRLVFNLPILLLVIDLKFLLIYSYKIYLMEIITFITSKYEMRLFHFKSDCCSLFFSDIVTSLKGNLFCLAFRSATVAKSRLPKFIEIAAH